MARVFRWRELLDEQRIPFIDRGANVKRGEINIKCPMCGSADPSFHLGLNLDSGFWACWRNESHRGKSPLRLIMALCHVPYWKAREIAGLSQDFVDPEGFDAIAARILGHSGILANEPKPTKQFLRLPRDFTPLTDPLGWRHTRYLSDHRGFGRWTADLADRYELGFSGEFAWRDRILIPYFIDGDLVTWTARAIGPAHIRYKDLSLDESLVPPKLTFFNYDAIIKGGSVLVLVEGPLDALKIDMFGHAVGVRAVALSTNSMTDEQIYMLGDADGQFERIVVMMDQASTLGIVDSMRLRQKLGHLANVTITPTPYGLKDAGEMSPKQALAWTDDLARNPI